MHKQALFGPFDRFEMHDNVQRGYHAEMEQGKGIPEGKVLGEVMLPSSPTGNL